MAMMGKFKYAVRHKFLGLATDSGSAACQVLAEYGAGHFNEIPAHRLKAFEASVRGAHIRYLLKRLEEVSLS